MLEAWQKLYPPRARVRWRPLSTARDRRLGIGSLGTSDHRTGEVTVDSRLKSRKRLEVLIHELLHLLEPTWSEARVLMAARWFARHLWAQGYRDESFRRRKELVESASRGRKGALTQLPIKSEKLPINCQFRFVRANDFSSLNRLKPLISLGI